MHSPQPINNAASNYASVLRPINTGLPLQVMTINDTKYLNDLVPFVDSDRTGRGVSPVPNYDFRKIIENNRQHLRPTERQNQRLTNAQKGNGFRVNPNNVMHDQISVRELRARNHRSDYNDWLAGKQHPSEFQRTVHSVIDIAPIRK